MATPSFASKAWCSPSLYRLPGISLPVNSSTMMTCPLLTTYSTSFSKREYALNNWDTLWIFSVFSEYSASNFILTCSLSRGLKSVSSSVVLKSGRTKKLGS